MKQLNLLPLRIDLFDGGAAGGTGAAPAGDGAEAQAGTQGAPADSQRGKRAEKVVYGKAPEETAQEAPDAGEQGSEDPKESQDPKERQRRYQELVNGEFKDLYTQDTQRIISQRFKETRTLQETLDAQQPVMQMLMERYGVGDAAGLASALEADNAYWEQAAESAGMTVEQYRQFKRMERENERLVKAQQQAVSQERARRQMADWMRQADEVKKTYQDFDLRQETADPQFLRLLQAGVPMQHAYEVLHMDLVKGQTAQAAEKKVADSIRANGMRPKEAGISSQTGVIHKSDVHKLTARDRREIARRVRQGEQVQF